jgi:hypothetical protein
MKKAMAMALALSFAALLAMVPDADARRGDDNPPPPECQVEDGGVLVCR